MHYRINRWLVTCVCVVLMTTGCAVKLMYNQLDWLIPWYVSDYISFTGKQKTFFQQRLAEHLEWHRNEQLPDYAALLERIATELEHGLDGEAIAAYQTEVERIADVIIARVTPDVVALFKDASDEQIEQLFTQFEDDNKEYRERFIERSEERVREARARSVIKGIQRWTGRLDSDQRARIEQWSKTYPSMVEEFLAARVAWQQALRDALQQRDDPVQFSSRITHILTTPGFGRNAAFEEKFARNQALLTVLYNDIHGSLSAAQKGRAIETLRSYAKDFRELAAD